MLCPEVTRFDTSSRHISNISHGKIGDPSFKPSLRSKLETLGTVENVSIVLPSSEQSHDHVSDSMRSMLAQDTQHYTVTDFTPAILFNKEFQHNFIKTGNLIISPTHNDNVVEQSVSLFQKVLHLSIHTNNLNIHQLESVCKRRFMTKNGLENFQLTLDDSVLDLKESQSRKLMSALEDVIIPVSLSWTHQDPNICPSSIAKYLCQNGFQVTEEDCQVTVDVTNNVSAPNLNDNDVEDIMDWMGHISLGIPTDLSGDHSVAVIKACGLYQPRALSHLVNTSCSLLTKSKGIPWLALSMHGPAKQAHFQGSQVVERLHPNVTVVVSRNGNCLIRNSESIDYSYCKKSKYN